MCVNFCDFFSHLTNITIKDTNMYLIGVFLIEKVPQC